jgi:predicted DNA-binding transcriptional regulator AlpA
MEMLVNNLPPSADPVLTMAAVMELTGLSEPEIRKKRDVERTFPLGLNYKGIRRWGIRFSDVERWLSEQTEPHVPNPALYDAYMERQARKAARAQAESSERAHRCRRPRKTQGAES